MSLASSRFLFLMASIAAALALGISTYLEYSVGLTPCSLCVLQRLCLMLFLVNSLVACVQVQVKEARSSTVRQGWFLRRGNRPGLASGLDAKPFVRAVC